jgi:branched-chain amino acid transport system permease protein
MRPAKSFPGPWSSWSSALIVALFVLVPYAYAALTGSAAGEAAGLARIHSAAKSVACAKGATPVTYIILVELLVVAGLLAIGSTGRGRRWGLASLLPQDGWYLLAFLLLMAAPFLIAWNTGSSACTRGKAYFWESIFVDVFILAMLAVSYNLMFGFTGVVSFGHAAFFGTGAYTVGLLMTHLAWPWWLAITAALLFGVVIALIKGFVGLRIKGLYFALFTLAFAEVFFLLAGNRILSDITGAENGFTFAVPDWLNMTKNRFFFYYMILGLFSISFVLVRRLIHSPTGRVLNALRDNEERAQMIGYNTFHFKLLSIVIAGLIATMSGVLRGLALKGASPNVLGLDFTMNPLLMTIVGGTGTFAGPVVGAFVLRLTEQLLRDSVVTIGGVVINIGDRWTLILGLIFILSVMVFPYGIVGTWQIKRLNTREGWLRLLGRTQNKTLTQTKANPRPTME